MGTFLKAQWAEFDRVIRPELKRTLYLPQEASNSFLYGPRKKGLCGIPVAADLSDHALIDTAFKLLTSLDDRVSELALSELMSTISSRIRSVPDDELLSRYLSGSDDAPFNTSVNPSRAPSSVWSRTRKSSRRNNVTWSFSDSSPTLSLLPGPILIGPAKRRSVMSTLKASSQGIHYARLVDLKSQGKTVECTSKSSASTHFLATGSFTRFADWRFIHRARLNLVALNSASHSSSVVDKRCRVCGYAQETLPHVLCHCMRNSRAYQLRHNAILDRIAKAASRKFHTLYFNSQIPGTSLRPDLVIARGNAAFIIDITVSFENRLDAFRVARDSKISKYTRLLSVFRRTYPNVSIEPVVVGALGAWDSANDSFISKLCTRSYASLMRKLIVSDTIRWSRDIYTEHITGTRQYSDPPASASVPAVQPPPPIVVPVHAPALTGQLPPPARPVSAVASPPVSSVAPLDLSLLPSAVPLSPLSFSLPSLPSASDGDLVCDVAQPSGVGGVDGMVMAGVRAVGDGVLEAGVPVPEDGFPLSAPCLGLAGEAGAPVLGIPVSAPSLCLAAVSPPS